MKPIFVARFGKPPRRGLDNPNAKLSPEQIQTIRSRRARGETAVSLAREFNVSNSTISSVINRYTWRQVKENV